MAAGVTLKALRDKTFETCPIIRIMPNTACAVGAGLTLYDCSEAVTETQLQGFWTAWQHPGGWSVWRKILSTRAAPWRGCGGAFACLFMEALADGAVSCGLPRDKANVYAAQMLRGAAALALESGQPFGAMKDAVCSPGGTTHRGGAGAGGGRPPGRGDERGDRGIRKDAGAEAVNVKNSLSG